MWFCHSRSYLWSPTVTTEVLCSVEMLLPGVKTQMPLAWLVQVFDGEQV